jgi:Ca2+:H+ antiporter
MVAGGVRRDRQFFDRTAASAQSSMLLLASAAFAMPAVFQLVSGGSLPGAHDEIVNFGSDVEQLSLAIALLLIGVYVAGLLFSLRTHRDLFNPESEDDYGHGEPWTVRRSVAMLGVAGVAVGVMSEILVGSIHEAAESAGLSEFFIGAIVVAIVGNAAEHWVAVLVAMKNKMDLAVNIAIGSSAQIALFVAPVLVVASFVIGPGAMPFVLNGFELAAVLLAAVIATQVTSEGESTWFEGVLLLAVYIVFGLAFGLA